MLLLLHADRIQLLKASTSHCIFFVLEWRKNKLNGEMETSDEDILANMTITKAFIVFYVGIVALLTVATMLAYVAPTITAIVLFFFLVYFLFMFFFMSSFGRARVVHNCFNMGKQQVKTTALLIALASFAFPLYPVLVLPITMLTVIQMMRGKCNLD